MARVYTDSSGVTLIIPDSSVNINVLGQPAGIATTGIIALVGEADQGPHWSEEEKLADNSFGPGDLQRVINKYGSGRLVDAFRGLIGASASPRIQGSFNRAILVKTNLSTKAFKNTSDGHGKFLAKLAGAKGNNIKVSILDETAEMAPTTGEFSYVPHDSLAASMAIRVNGGAQQTLAIAANTTPSALANAITQLTNLNAVGGIDRDVTQNLTPANNVELNVIAANEVEIKLQAPALWANSPKVGDTLRIPSGSVIAGTGSANVGWYLVTAVSNLISSAKLTAKKISAGAPVNVASTAFSSTPSNDIVVYSSLKIDNMSGMDRNVLAGLVGTNASISVSGSEITFTLAAPALFAAAPKINDLLFIPLGSPFAGAGNANVGWYKITAMSNHPTSALIKAARLSNGLPVAVASTAIANTSDIQVYKPDIDGAGKTLAIKDNAGAADLAELFKKLGQDEPVEWLGDLLLSAAERKAKFEISQSNPLVSESFVHGGNVVLQLGYEGTTATATISTISDIKRLQTSVSGGVGGNLDIALKDYATINDLVEFINQQPGYTAAAISNLEGQKNPQILDEVTSIGICTSISGHKPGRIKRDIHDMTKGLNNLAQNSILVEYENNKKAGLPEAEAALFLAGGAKGGTTGLAFSQAIDALAGVRCNFVVPLVSQDATLDKLEGLTEASSTYTVAAVNAAVKTHVLNMSNAKTKRHRVGIVSVWGKFNDAKAMAQTMSTHRIACTFQKVKDLNSKGEIETFQPWMAAVKAAGMQAAGFYKAIFNKAVNLSGIVDPADFDNQTVSLCEDALLNGLMPLSKSEDGSINFLSDQMTYGLDGNFVYNSLQAVYTADIVALTLADSLKKAFVGESVADVTTSSVISFLKGKFAELLDKKLLAATTEFPAGWKSIQVSISEGVLQVRSVVILATAIYFIPINLDIEGVKESASA